MRLQGGVAQAARRAAAAVPKLIWLLVVIVVVENAARLAVPYLVHLGIDNGIPPILAGEGRETLITVVVAVLACALIQAWAR